MTITALIPDAGIMRATVDTVNQYSLNQLSKDITYPRSSLAVKRNAQEQGYLTPGKDLLATANLEHMVR